MWSLRAHAEGGREREKREEGGGTRITGMKRSVYRGTPGEAHEGAAAPVGAETALPPHGTSRLPRMPPTRNLPAPAAAAAAPAVVRSARRTGRPVPGACGPPPAGCPARRPAHCSKCGCRARRVTRPGALLLGRRLIQVTFPHVFQVFWFFCFGSDAQCGCTASVGAGVLWCCCGRDSSAAADGCIETLIAASAAVSGAAAWAVLWWHI